MLYVSGVPPTLVNVEQAKPNAETISLVPPRLKEAYEVYEFGRYQKLLCVWFHL